MKTPILLWDHDGVLVDTERWYFEATRVALSKVDVDLSQELYLELMVKGNGCWHLAREHGASTRRIETLRALRDDLYQEYLRTRPIEIEGVSDVLSQLASDHRMAIVTTSRRVDFQLIHRKRDLVRHFEFVLTVEDASRAKPHPDPYLAGLSRFGATPAQAVVIEDSARGLKSAIAAGIDCLVIRNDFTTSQDFTGAWCVVDSIRDAVPVLTERCLAGSTPERVP